MSSIFDVILNGASGVAHCWVLPNVRGEHRERWIGSHDSDKLEKFARKYDNQGFGTFYCVSTIEPGKPRKKEFARELSFLHADIDFKDTDSPPEQIERILRELKLPPSRLHGSGRGLHAFWQLTAPVILPDGMDQVETLLRKLTDRLGGDRSVAHCAALLRVPGTHNSKNGQWLPVRILKEGIERYTIADIDAWLRRIHEPVLVRKSKTKETNPFLRLYEELGYKAPTDVQQRLANMQVGADNGNGVHAASLSITGSLTAAGKDEDYIVDLVLKRIKELDGTSGWNWQREERTLRTMIRDMQRKIAARNGGGRAAR